MIPGTSDGNWLFIYLLGKGVQRRGKGNITYFGLKHYKVRFKNIPHNPPQILQELPSGRGGGGWGSLREIVQAFESYL